MSFGHLREQLSREPSISWQPIAEGVVCDYDDGADYVVLRKPPGDIASWIREFKLVNLRRTRFIDALRVCLTLQGMILHISETGAYYSDENEDYVRELWLGENLSHLLRQHSEIDAYAEFNKQHFISTSVNQFSEALKHKDQNTASTAFETPDSTETDSFQLVAIAWGLGLIESDRFPESPTKEMCVDLERRNPVIQLAIRLISQFPERIRPENGDLHVAIGDKSISWNGDNLSQRIETKSVESVLAEIVAEVEQKDRERDSAKTRFLSHLASLGIAMDESWDEHIHFGSTHVQYRCNLNALLESENPIASMQGWLKENSLPSEILETSGPRIEARCLPTAQPLEIPALDDYELDPLRGEARAIITRHIRDGFTYPSKSWGDQLWSPIPPDPWATEDWWLGKAKKQHDRTLLWRLGDHVALHETVEECRRLAEVGWDAGFSVYEGCNPLDILRSWPHVWSDENPIDIIDDNGSAQRAPWNKFFDQLPYEFKRFARKCVRAEMNEQEDTELRAVAEALKIFTEHDISDFLSSSDIEAIRERCIAMAKGPFHDGNAGTEFLEVAHWFGWFEVIDALADNAQFWEAFRTWPVQVSMIGEYALALSLFGRNNLTRRLAAWTFYIDDIRYRRESRQRDLLSFFNDHREEQRLAAAIAWSRTDNTVDWTGAKESDSSHE